MTRLLLRLLIGLGAIGLLFPATFYLISPGIDEDLPSFYKWVFNPWVPAALIVLCVPQFIILLEEVYVDEEKQASFPQALMACVAVTFMVISISMFVWPGFFTNEKLVVGEYISTGCLGAAGLMLMGACFGRIDYLNAKRAR